MLPFCSVIQFLIVLAGFPLSECEVEREFHKLQKEYEY